MKLFKVNFPNGKSFVVLAKGDWTNLVHILNNFTNESSIIITPLSFWESVKYIFKK
jgi:hypothetical protein